MQQAGEDELARIWTKVEKIRSKQAAKPKPRNSPLPQHTPPVAVQEAAMVVLNELMKREEHVAWEAAQNAFDREGGMVDVSDVVIAALHALTEQEGE
jgi:hypothetical protein